MSDFPAKITDRLKEARNNLTYSLAKAVAIGDTIIYSTSPLTAAPDKGAFHIGTEVFFYTGKTTNTFTGVLGGQDGTTAQDHQVLDGGNEIVFGPEAHYINTLNEEVVAIQEELGVECENVIKTPSGIDNGKVLTVDSSDPLGIKWDYVNIQITSVETSATPTPVKTGQKSIFLLTGLDKAAEFQKPLGLENGDMFLVRINDNGTKQDLDFVSDYSGFFQDLPEETIEGKTMYLLFIYNATSTKLEMLSMAVEE